MRRHGAHHSMHKLTEYSKAKRGLIVDEAPPPRVRLDHQDLYKAFRSMDKALIQLLKKRGAKPCVRANWARLFQELDDDGSGRLHFGEFARAARALGVPEHVVSDRDLAGLWTVADDDASGDALFL